MSDPNNSNNATPSTGISPGSGAGGGGAGGGNAGATTQPTTITIPIPNNSIWITGTGGGGAWVAPVPASTNYIPFTVGDVGPPVPEKKSYKDGCVCKKCKEIYPYAEPNQDDGTLVCYGCRIVW